MARIRLLLAFALLALILAIGPAALAQEGTTGDSTATTGAGDAPAVVVDTTPAAVEQDAWTFRFLVPTVLAISGIALIGVLAGYGLRVRGRYRVAR